MGFSIDYQFIQGRPDTSHHYEWVIEGANAEKPWVMPVQLGGRDTLQTFVLDWQPRHGPFVTYIAEVRPDGSRQPLSAVEPLEHSD